MSFEVLSRFTDVDEKVLFHGDSEDHESAIDQTVFDEELWEDMKAGKLFKFDIDNGCYETRDTSSNFPIQLYILAQSEGKSLKEILGEGVALVTHRAVLLQTLEKQMGMMYKKPKDMYEDPYPEGDPVTISCERLNGVTFVKLNRSLDHGTGERDHYRSVRVKRFDGPDLPGCVGNVPARNFASFPIVGDMYSTIKMTDANGKKVLYTSQFTRHSPDGKTVDSRAINEVDWRTKNFKSKDRVLAKSALQAKLACIDHYIFMYFNTMKSTLQADIRASSDVEEYLDSFPSADTTLNIEQLFAKVERVLDLHGRCTATLQKKDSNGWQFVPRLVDAKYEPFLSKAFRDRFATKKPKEDISENIDQKKL